MFMAITRQVLSEKHSNQRSLQDKDALHLTGNPGGREGKSKAKCC